MSPVRPLALVSLLVIAASSLGDPPPAPVRVANLMIRDGQVVISADEIRWGWANKPQGTLISINDTHYLRHDQEGVVRLVGANEIGEGCYWRLQALRSETSDWIDDADGRHQIVEQVFGLTPRDPKLDGWGMTFFRGALSLQPKTDPRPIFRMRFHVVGEPSSDE